MMMSVRSAIAMALIAGLGIVPMAQTPALAVAAE